MFYDVFLCGTDIDVNISCYYRYGKIFMMTSECLENSISENYFSYFIISLFNNIHKKAHLNFHQFKFIFLNIQSRLMQSSYHIISLILSSTLNAYIEHILISFVHIYVIVSVLSDGYIK